MAAKDAHTITSETAVFFGLHLTEPSTVETLGPGMRSRAPLVRRQLLGKNGDQVHSSGTNATAKQPFDHTAPFLVSRGMSRTRMGAWVATPSSSWSLRPTSQRTSFSMPRPSTPRLLCNALVLCAVLEDALHAREGFLASDRTGL